MAHRVIQKKTNEDLVGVGGVLLEAGDGVFELLERDLLLLEARARSVALLARVLDVLVRGLGIRFERLGVWAED